MTITSDQGSRLSGRFLFYKVKLQLRGSELLLWDWDTLAQKLQEGWRPFGCKIACNSMGEKPSVPFPFYANVRDL
ncbi:hypothetical protein SLEP1_g13649 [Rubroshorea leprosula]|uniref:DUF1737 domain-containing protein n=1 Tax=Rubroshorea leprosula TaxID=152421 RepID=A0AAV5IPL4_9ROSI|nr:hypothetical protein SLEP1_g13649 [Rubroshorea leprosula]